MTPPARGEPTPPDGQDVDAAEFDAIVDKILGQKPRPIDWNSLSREAAAAQWTALDQWVRWLARRYSLDHRDIPPCWYEHGDVVEELSALHTAHRAAYDAAAAPSSPSEWLQTLANTRTRLQLSVARTGCRPREHRPPSTADWASEPTGGDYQRGFAAHVDADLGTRS